MPKITSRPMDLPDYTDPPLSEVVLGVQFAPAAGYRQILAGDVWKLFKRNFPTVEEVMPLAPIFETFGPLPSSGMLNVNIMGRPQHNRFWFLTDRKDELIQFQSDRLIHNWRKVGDRTNEYPRFEKMIGNFTAELNKLEKYFDSLSPQRLVCNQAEISYINQIVITDESSDDASRWFRFFNFEKDVPDDVSATMRRAILNSTGAPIGRLFWELNTGVTPNQQKMFVLSLTFRGAPEDTAFGTALDFLKLGRELIVNEFAAITTDSAQEGWGRKR
jgi:uncharacterized protein (TIGR04255 family)